METKNDVLWNPDAFMQIGDLVASSFLMAAVILFGVSVFILVQWRMVHKDWKLAVLISAMVPLMASCFTFFRTNYWISTQTNPIEFRFFDWFLTVPLMAIVFYFLLKPIGARKRMLIGLFLAALWMLGWGYLGEALEPENSITWGILGSIGFACIIGLIMGIGYPKIFREGVHPYHKMGYITLSILLPLGWSIYPIGYMSVPGNVLEGVLGVDTVAIMYNIADVFNKAGLALGTAFIASKVGGYYEEEEKEESYTPPASKNYNHRPSDVSKEIELQVREDESEELPSHGFQQKKYLN